MIKFIEGWAVTLFIGFAMAMFSGYAGNDLIQHGLQNAIRIALASDVIAFLILAAADWMGKDIENAHWIALRNFVLDFFLYNFLLQLGVTHLPIL